MTKKRKQPVKKQPSSEASPSVPAPPIESLQLTRGWHRGISIPDAPSDVEGGESFRNKRDLTNLLHQSPERVGSLVRMPPAKRKPRPRAPRKPKPPPKPSSPHGSDGSDPENGGGQRRGWKKNGFRLFVQQPIQGGVEYYGYANLLGHTYYMRGREVYIPGRPVYISGKLHLRH